MKSTSLSYSRDGFTLVELSVVIVIIGIVVGGILSAKAMVRASTLRTVAKDANMYITNIGTFRSQYRYLPGDMPTATRYWSSAANGTGDGKISGDERFQAWYQLNQAELVEATYRGSDAGTPDFKMGDNIPNSRVEGGGFSVFYASLSASTTNFVIAGNLLAFGAHTSDTSPPINAILVPEDAYNIDMKSDDGVPGTGNWIANSTNSFGASTGCASDNTSSATYNVSLSSNECAFYIKTGF